MITKHWVVLIFGFGVLGCNAYSGGSPESCQDLTRRLENLGQQIENGSYQGMNGDAQAMSLVEKMDQNDCQFSFM